MSMRNNGSARRLAAFGTAAIALFVTGPKSASAADLGDSCCADLAERIAELEATAARKSNQKVEVKITGVVNRALLFWNDGVERNVYGVDSPQDGSAITLEGEVEIGRGWKAGYLMGLDTLVASSDTLDQLVDSSGGKVEVSDSYWWISHERYGTVRLGLTDTASDGVDNINLAESDAAADVEVANWLASFFLRARDGGLLDVRWGDFIPSVAGDTVNTVTYVSPIVKGFEFSASSGKDDFRDVGLRYSETWAKSIIVRAAIGYYRNTSEEPEAIEPLEDEGVGASLAFRHIPTGLNIAFNYGWQDHTDRCAEPGAVSGKCRGDDGFFYVKGGLVREWLKLGPTALYGEFYRGNRRFNESDPEVLGALLRAPGDFDIDPDNPDPTLPAAELKDSSVSVWGFGIVQKIGEDILIGSDEPKDPGEKKEYAGVWEEAPIEVYLGYRHYEIDIDLIASDGASSIGRKLKDFDAVMGGAVIRF
jgi:hypothetical protein